MPAPHPIITVLAHLLRPDGESLHPLSPEQLAGLQAKVVAIKDANDQHHAIHDLVHFAIMLDQDYGAREAADGIIRMASAVAPAVVTKLGEAKRGATEEMVGKTGARFASFMADGRPQAAAPEGTKTTSVRDLLKQFKG